MTHRPLLVGWLVGTLLAAAASAEVRITVDPGDADRRDAVVSMNVPDGVFKQIQYNALRADGFVLVPVNPKATDPRPVQTIAHAAAPGGKPDGTTDLLWLEPSLKAR